MKPCTTLKNLVVSFTLNNPTITCIGTQAPFRKLITETNVSMPLWDIHKMNLAETIVTNKIFNDTCKSVVFFTIARNIPSKKKKNEKKIKHKGIDIKLTSKAKCSYKWKGVCKPCKCKTPNFQEIFVALVINTLEMNHFMQKMMMYNNAH